MKRRYFEEGTQVNDWQIIEDSGWYVYMDGGWYWDEASQMGLCPVCGEKIAITGETKDGRIIGSCGDAFTMQRWVKP